MRKNAFTLAETLITLGIIGVVSSMLIKTIVNLRTDDQTNNIMAQKTLGNITNATKEIIMFDTSDKRFSSACPSGSSANCIMGLYQKYLSFVKIYTTAEATAALGNVTTGVGSIASGNMGRLSDGAIVGFLYDASCATTVTVVPLPAATQRSVANTCGYAFYDVNGSRGPNVLGADRFVVNFKKSGIKVEAQ